MWFVTLIHQEVSQSCQRLKNWGLKLTGQRSQCGQTLKPLGAYYLVFIVPINWCRWGGGRGRLWEKISQGSPSQTKTNPSMDHFSITLLCVLLKEIYTPHEVWRQDRPPVWNTGRIMHCCSTHILSDLKNWVRVLKEVRRTHISITRGAIPATNTRHVLQERNL